MLIKCFMSGFQIKYFNSATNRIEITNTNPERESVRAFKRNNKHCLILSVKPYRAQVSTLKVCGYSRSISESPLR